MNYLKHPPIIQWEVTPFCNHDCIHCYNYWRSEDTKKQDLVFNKNTAEQYYLKIAKRIIDAKPVIVTITGGEPISVFSKIKSSIDLFLKEGIYVTINTNSTLIDDEIAQYLKDNRIPLFVSLPCSNASVCNSIINVENGFKRIDSQLRKLISIGIEVHTNMVVSKLNLNYVYETAKYVKEELGLNYFCATKASLPINAKSIFSKYLLNKNDFEYLLHILDKVKQDFCMEIDSSSVYPFCGLPVSCYKNFAFKRRCNAGRISFAITATGDIKACARDSKEYGNILKNTFSDSIKRMISWQNGKNIPAECKDCRHLWLCGGGCRIDAEVINGSICSLDPLVNLKNKNKEFLNKESTCVINENEILFVADGVNFVEEDTCYRISHRKRFVFISKPFANYIFSHKTFTPKDISNYFNLDTVYVSRLLASFVQKGLVQSRT